MKNYRTRPANSTNGLFEAKFEVPIHLRERLSSILRHSALRPQNFASSRVRTVYFDDLKDTSLNDSQDGQLIKRKYRLREYLDAPAAAAFYSIEVKLRDNNITGKAKRLIYKRLPSSFTAQTFRSLICALEDLEGAFFNDIRNELPEEELFPSSVIFYERERFEDTREDARYNLDTHVSMAPVATRGGGGGGGWAKEGAGGAEGGVKLPHDIFEIKSKRPGFFPHFLEGLELLPFSFSKFAWGRCVLG